MRHSAIYWPVLSAAVALALLSNPRAGSAAITSTLVQSSMQGYFASQSVGSNSAYEDSNVPFTHWTAPGIGPYGNLTHGLLNVPPAPTPPVYPATVGNWAFGGAGYSHSFTDSATHPTTGSFTIIAHNNPNPTTVNNENIRLPSMVLTQAPGSTGYAYEQLDFVADYLISGGILAASAPNHPISIHGNVDTVANAYVEFGGAVNYTWIDLTGTTSTPQLLGQVDYQFKQGNGGPFTATIYPNAGTLAATPTTNGILELTGQFWVDGDPSSIEVSSSVPEPTTLALVWPAGLLLIRRNRK
jgi:hypothetical protein